LLSGESKACAHGLFLRFGVDRITRFRGAKLATKIGAEE
jgi:hypothetical protein